MICYFAPLEGITGQLYRNLHHRYFGGVDKYYMPFITPTREHLVTPKQFQEVNPDNNQGFPAVPQLLTRYSEDVVWMVEELAGLGYGEVNLNLGCPSGTVVAKRKGSGLLADLDYLDSFLEEIFSQTSHQISIKTRLGIREDQEFWRILEIYNQYPICELTVHPRVQKDFYKGEARRGLFQEIQAASKNPLCYNGDIYTLEDAQGLDKQLNCPLMLGRGLIANPALGRQLRGGNKVSRQELEAFVEDIFQGYAQAFGSARNATLRMKELWTYVGQLFVQPEKQLKALKKTQDVAGYQREVARLFQTLEMK